MSIETVIFDHSGTISDDFSIVLASANNILNIFGRSQVGAAQYRADFGKDIAAVYKKWGVEASLEDLNRIHESFLKTQPRPQPIPFAVETVRIVRMMVRRIVSFSAHPQSELEKDLRDWEIYDLFKGAVYGGVRKQSSDDFERMLGEVGANRESALYVGDTTVDIDLAHGSSVGCAAVINPKYCYQLPEKVKAHVPQANHYLTHISALNLLLKKSA